MAADSEGPTAMTHTELRKAAADYIRSHPADFIPFIFDEDGKGDEEEQLNAYVETLANTAVRRDRGCMAMYGRSSNLFVP